MTSSPASVARAVGRDASPGPSRGTRRDRWILPALAAVAVVAAVLVVVDAVGARRALRRAQVVHASTLGELTATRAERDAARAELRTEEALANARGLERDADRLAAIDLQGVLGAVDGELAGAQGERDRQAVRLVTVGVCLGGVREALDATAARNQAGAQNALRRVSAACHAAAGSRDDAVYGFDFADPFLLRSGADIYGFATNAGGGSVQVIRSGDLAAWALVGNALANLPAWAVPNSTWAPAVLARPDGFVLYYTVREAATGRQCISAAYGAAPAGPYFDVSVGPLECSAQGSIDPSPFVDDNGAAYLLWKSERPAQLWSRRLADDGKSFAGPPALLLTARHRWEDGNVEAPSMMATAGGYWLYFSGNDWDGRSYAEGLARCRSPLGPCDHLGSTPVLASHDAIAGPGGGEVFLDGSGTWWLAYHAYREPAVGYPNSRLLHLRRIALDASGTPSLG